MQAKELLQLTKWFDENIIDRQIPKFYQTLFNRLNHNATQNNKRAFDEEKIALLNALQEVSFVDLTLEQVQMLDKLEIADLLGTSGVEKIEDVLYKNSLDVATAASTINEYFQKFNIAQTKFSNLSDALGEVIDDSFDELKDGQVLMRVYFQQEASITNISDFKRYGNIWYEIGRGITMALNKTPEDINIIGAQKGSIIIEMALAVGIATSVSSILLKALKVSERVIEVLKKVEELKAMKLSNQKIIQDLSKEAKELEEKESKLILNELVKELNLDQNSDGDKVIALNKSIKNLIKFTKDGGLVDFIQDESIEDEEVNESEETVRLENDKLLHNLIEIREMKDRMKRLGNGESKK